MGLQTCVNSFITRKLTNSVKTLQVVKLAFMAKVYSFRLSVRPFVCSFIRISFRRVRAKFYIKVSQVRYISLTTHQKAFICGP